MEDATNGGSMIAIIGHIDVDPAQRDELVASTVELQRATAGDEPGCLVYTIAADPANPGRISIVELWETATRSMPTSNTPISSPPGMRCVPGPVWAGRR